LSATGKYASALPFVKTPEEFGQRMYGPDHKTTSILAFNYGSMLLYTDDLKAAKDILKKVLG
jgi:hypothetical protein